MVASRRHLSPSPPEISGARRVPDDPPPEPTHNSIGGRDHFEQSPSIAVDHVDGSKSLAGTSAKDEAQTTVQRPENGEVNIAIGNLPNSPTGARPGFHGDRTVPPQAVTNEVDEQDSDAPEEASASFAAEAALAQRALERQTRNSVRERRRSTRRAAAEKQRQQAQHRNEHAALSNLRDADEDSGKVKMSADQGGYRETGDNARETSVLLSDEMLEAAQKAVEEKRRAERERRKAEKLKRQSKKVQTHLPIKQVAGIEIHIAGRVRKKTEARGRGKRNPASSFLERCIRNAGTRVPSAVAARIASAARRRKR